MCYQVHGEGDSSWAGRKEYQQDVHTAAAQESEILPQDIIKKMEKEVTFTGKEYSKDRVNFLTVELVK